MKLLKDKRYITVEAIVALICTAVLLILRSYVGCVPVREVYFEDISDMDIDRDGGLTVLNKSGTVLYRISESGKIDLVLKGNSKTGRGFVRGLQVTQDGDGNIYVHNRIPSETMISSIGEENVMVFSPYGVYKGTYLDRSYDSCTFRAAVCELQNIDGVVYAILAEDNVVEKVNVLTGEKETYALENANLLVNGATYNGEDKCLYAVLRDGRIVKSREGAFVTEYAIEEGREDIVLSDICAGRDGTVYISEIVNNVIFSLTEGKLEVFSEEGDEPFKLVGGTSDEAVVTESTYSVSCVDAEGANTVDCAKYSGLINGVIIFCYLVLLLGFLCLVCICVFIFDKIFVSSSGKVKTIGTFGMFACLLTVVFCVMLWQGMKDDAMATELENDIHIAGIIDKMVDAEDLKKLRSCTDFDSPEYRRIRESCEVAIFDESGKTSKRYVIIYTLEENDSVYVRYSTEQNYGCNYPYIWTDGTDERELYESCDFMTFDELPSDPTGTFLVIYGPLTDENGEVAAVLEVGCDYDELMDSTKRLIVKIGISIFALMIVVLLIVLEITEYQNEKKLLGIEGVNEAKKAPSLKMLRLMVFLIFFITNLTTPFLSIYAMESAKAYDGFLSLSPEILAAIPISAEVFFGAIFSMLGNRIIDKINVRKSAMLGTVLFIGGLLTRCLSPDLWVLSAGNAVMGAGWGILLLIVNSKIASTEDEEEQEGGFTNYNIALQNGMNSGIVAGGFLLVFLNHNGVFVISTALALIVLVFVRRFIFDDAARKSSEAKEGGSTREMLKFIFAPRVLIYFVCIVIPIIAASYYLNFLYPIIGSELGMSETNIGYSYLANGLVTIVLSNAIVRFVTKKFSNRTALFLASLLYLVTFVMVGVWTTVPVLIAALVILPVSDSFGYVIQETYYSRLEETKKIGYERAMGVYSLFENLSQSIGSFLFGYVLVVGVTKGMIVFGIAIGVMGLMFLAFSKREKR